MQIFAQPQPKTHAALWRRDLLLLTLFIGALFAFGLGNYPLQNPDEGRYAEIPREMVATGNFVTPRLNGVKYFEKPPLFYWCVAASVRLFGSEEWTLRVWPAAFALAGVLMTYAAGQALYGRTVGLAGAVVLATSLLYFGLAHVLIIDMAVSVLIAGTLWAFIVGVQA
ncbi:MAG: glycosyltransferase family 39 protein, partial [Opitutaceae bacterium]